MDGFARSLLTDEARELCRGDRGQTPADDAPARVEHIDGLIDGEVPFDLGDSNRQQGAILLDKRRHSSSVDCEGARWLQAKSDEKLAR
jgi:hypothetical protein